MNARSPSPSVAAAAHPGRRLGDFVIGAPIGSGAFGAIHLAEQVGLARQVVVKILREGIASDETLRLRFLREARLASTLDHPYAAHVYAFGVEPDGLSWIAMELVRGASLADRLAAAPMPLSDFVPFFERLCEVVQTAHEHGIVHRDIKPQNVMVIERAGALLPKLLDLGIAKDAAAMDGDARRRDDDAAPFTPEPPTGVETRASAQASGARLRLAGSADRAGGDAVASPSLTSEGDVMGSPGYMAPEQWTSADRVDARSDVYALGVLAFEAIAGRRPFSGSATDLAEQHLVARVPPLPDSAPRELQCVLERAMAKEPDDRYGSALDLARALRHASGIVAEGVTMPRLARGAVDVALRDYPQPIADAVAELDVARNVYRALDAAERATQVTLRVLVVLALAAWRSDEHGSRAPIVGELLSALRKRRLEDDEWLELLRAVAGHAAIGALEDALRGDVGAALAALVARHAGRRDATAQTERAAAAQLAEVLATTSDLLRALGFLRDHELAVVGEDDHAELWTGARRKHRASRPLPAQPRRATGELVLLAGDGRVLSLAPLAEVARPSAHADAEIFLLDGRGRRGMTLVAFAGGFERTSEAAQRWLDRVCAVVDEGTSDRIPIAAPYRGLAPLGAADADVFFGRERELDGFLNRLRAEPLLVVVGPSGAGKSSFVRAGVIPSLGASFQPIVLRPGGAPVAAVKARLAALGVAIDDLATEADAAAVGRRVRDAARARDATWVVVVDQFEETFTLVRDRAERAAFLAWLACLASSASDPVRVVVTLRDDFLARLQHEPAFEGRLAPAIELLATPNEAALRRILVEPARRAGFAFDSEALVGAMVRAVEGRAGALALLSFAASKMWEARDREAQRIRSSAYAAMGGVAGALARHAEDVLTRMTARQRTLVRAAFRRLVTSEGTREAAAHDDLVAMLGGDDAARSVIEQLVAARLLVVAEGDDGVERVEVIHEALLSAWPRLVDWRREDAAGDRLRDQLRAAARQWETRGRPRSLLWRDELLDEYRRWWTNDAGGLTPSEVAFGRASLAEALRGRRWRLALIALLAIATAVTSYVAWQEGLAKRAAEGATRRAEQASLDAARANDEAREAALRARDAARIAAARLETDPTARLALLREVEAREPLPSWAPLAREALHGGVAPVVATFHDGPVLGVAFSPDGARIASASDDTTVRIWSADGGGEPIVLRGHTERVRAVAFSPDGRRVASGSQDGTVRIWSADGSGDPLVLRGHAKGVRAVAFSPDGARVASGSFDGTVRVWRADGAGEALVLRGHEDGVRGVAFSPDGRRIASASNDRTVRVWSADGRGAPLVLRGHADFVTGVAFAPDGARLASSSADGTVRIWRADGVGAPLVLRGHTASVDGVAFSPDGAHVASTSDDGTARVWPLDGGAPLVLRGHAEYVDGVAFSPDGRRLVTGSFDRTARVWDLDEREEPLVLRGHGDAVGFTVFTHDGRRVVSASADKTIRVWNADGTGAPIILRGHAEYVDAVAVSPDDRRIVSGSDDETVRVWNADGTGAPLVLRGHSGAVESVAFSPDGARIASGGTDATIRLWPADGRGDARVLRGHGESVEGVAFSPDGRRVASGSSDKTVRVWNLDDASDTIILRGHDAGVTSVAFSADGRRIASASNDDTVRLWSADGTADPIVLRGHAGHVNRVAFAPDGRIVSASSDRTLRIWSADGRGEPIVLTGHTDVVAGVAFSPDGLTLVSGSSDGTVRVWHDLAPLAVGDARLWTATNDCLTSEIRKRLLGVDDAVAAALRERCVARVTARRALR